MVDALNLGRLRRLAVRRARYRPVTALHRLSLRGAAVSQGRPTNASNPFANPLRQLRSLCPPANSVYVTR